MSRAQGFIACARLSEHKPKSHQRTVPQAAIFYLILLLCNVWDAHREIGVAVACKEDPSLLIEHEQAIGSYASYFMSVSSVCVFVGVCVFAIGGRVTCMFG